MTNDPSMTITGTTPRPGGERQYQQRGQDHSPARDGGQ